MPLLRSKTLTISINCPPSKIYDFVSNPENLPKWGKTYCRSIKRSNGEWIIETPQGEVKIRIAGKNEFGVLDHYITPFPGAEVLVPTRVVQNGSGSEVIFTVFRQFGMTDNSFFKDIGLVEQDLKRLKAIMELK
jgi:hypothetical protein